MNTKTIARFLSKIMWVSPDGKWLGEDECWNWLGAKDRLGYGGFWFPERGKHTRAHQVSWMICNGDIPEGVCICHHCDNRACVNPKHLYLGTMKDNVKDREMRDRSNRRFLYGENHPQHGTNSKFNKLSENDVREIRRLKATGTYTLKEIGKMFSVSPGLINNICHGRKWAWLK